MNQRYLLANGRAFVTDHFGLSLPHTLISGTLGDSDGVSPLLPVLLMVDVANNHDQGTLGVAHRRYPSQRTTTRDTRLRHLRTLTIVSSPPGSLVPLPFLDGAPIRKLCRHAPGGLSAAQLLCIIRYQYTESAL